MEKRTKRGHCGQSTDRSAARGRKLLRGNQERLLLQNTRVGSNLLQRVAAGGAFPDSRAVRALSAVSALCPCLHKRRDQNQLGASLEGGEHSLPGEPCPQVNRHAGRSITKDRVVARIEHVRD